MGTRYLIDTCAIIKYLNSSFPQKGIAFIDSFVNIESNISFITEIELQVWKGLSSGTLGIYQQFISSSKIYNIEKPTIHKTIEIRKNYNLKIPDAIIASTAVLNNLTLVSDNDKDFLKVVGLNYINPNSMI